MRTIKFRVWNQEDCFFWGEGEGMSLKKIAFNFYDELFKENKLIFQQFTGLKDKNEKEIYEGDILQIPDEEVKGSVRRPYGHVWYSELSAEYIMSYNHLYSEVSEQLWHRNIDSFVVGNIHQNPELIN